MTYPMDGAYLPPFGQTDVCENIAFPLQAVITYLVESMKYEIVPYSFQINDFDQKHDNQGLFTFKYNWIIVANCGILGNIEYDVGNITDIVVVCVNNMNSSSTLVCQHVPITQYTIIFQIYFFMSGLKDFNKVNKCTNNESSLLAIITKYGFPIKEWALLYC